MEISELQQAIMHRDGCTVAEAAEIILDMKERVADGEDPEEVLFDEGFEPDYVFDILPNLY